MTDDTPRHDSLDHFPVVTICGSMRFYARMLEVAADLTSAGRIVLMPHDASLTGIPDKTATEHGAMLDAMHRAKIRLSQSVYVVNAGGYIGESTRGEITYAAEFGILIEYDVRTEVDDDQADGGTCRKCHQSFDQADTRFDGHAEDRSMPGFCRSCVDRCHDADSDHRCVICA